MTKKDTCEPCMRMRIRGVDNTLGGEFKNIAAHIGISSGKLMKQELAKLVATYPDHMKVKKEKLCRPAEIEIRGIGKKLKEDLIAIAKNMNMDPAELVKCKFTEIINSYPQNMKQPMME